MGQEQIKATEKERLLIKEFIGKEWIPEHLTWNDIMPVCLKFDMLEDNFDDITDYEAHCDRIDNAVTCYEILPVFEKLVEAITWYNNQTQNH